MEDGMQDLIARLEAAEVGSQELNGLIFRALADDPNGKDHWFMSCAELMTEDNADSVTVSLDAVLALAERISWRVWSIDMSIAGRASVLLQSLEDRPGKDPETGAYMIGKDFSSGSARTPALALCIAILRAKQIDTASNPR